MTKLKTSDISFGGDPSKKPKLSKTAYTSTHKVCKCGAKMPIIGGHTVCLKCKRKVKSGKRRYNWWGRR